MSKEIEKWCDEITLPYLYNAFSRQEINEISELLIKHKKEIECVTCGNWNAMFYIEEGIPNFLEKDENGKTVSEEAAIQKSKFRFKCPECRQESCAHCKESPYHSGLTCQQHSRQLKEVRCKYCFELITDEKLKKRKCCKKKECELIYKDWCKKVLPCGHNWYGSVQSKTCMPCLNEKCVEKNPAKTYSAKGEDFCSQWFSEGLEDKPWVQLQWGHVFHSSCILEKLKMKWSTAYINFEHLNCDIWKAPIECDHISIKKLIDEDVELKAKVQKVATEEAKKEGIPESDYQDAPYNGDLGTYALLNFAIYEWFKCKKLYGGGRQECENGLRNVKPEDIKCSSWKDAPKIGAEEGYDVFTEWNKHGKDHLVYKCRFCCSHASFFCWGETHFCEDCHRRQENEEYIDEKTPDELPQCSSRSDWPLGIAHPPNGTNDYAIKCLLCE